MMIYRPDFSKIDPSYIVKTIYSAIGRSYIEAKGKGSTVGHLRVPEVYNFPCLLPPLEEQRAILCEWDRRIGPYTR
jgi:type I restriction enzyme S subunit